jgi:peroxiredoxin
VDQFTCAFLSPKDVEAGLLRVGQSAPNFQLKLLDGRVTIRANLLKEKKALLVSFWFVACPGCQQEFEHLKRIYADLRAKGLEILP